MRGVRVGGLDPNADSDSPWIRPQALVPVSHLVRPVTTHSQPACSTKRHETTTDAPTAFPNRTQPPRPFPAGMRTL